MSLVLTEAVEHLGSNGIHELSPQSFDSRVPVELISYDPQTGLRAAEAAFQGKAHLAGPTPHAEISGFWPTVREEIFLGAWSPTRAYAARELVDILRLDELMERDPRALSGGETARVVLASHLLSNPSVLLVDSLFEEIDIATRRELGELITTDRLHVLWVNLGHLALPGRRIRWDVDENTVTAVDAVANSVEDSWSRIALSLEVLDTNVTEPGEALRVVKLSCSRGKRPILKEVSFSLATGGIGLLLGPNGSGKTTLLECIAGLLPSQGELSIETGDLRTEAARNVAYSPQDADEDVIEKSILDEVVLAARDVDAKELLTACAVPPGVWEQPVANSSAYKKVASIISAVARNRPLCLLDEPTLSCGAAEKSWIMAAIFYQKKRGGATLLTSHDGEFLGLLATLCAGAALDPH